MKKSISLLGTVAAFALCFPVTSNAATQVYDLKADWSDTQNPNGAWSYRLEPDGGLLSSDPFPWSAFNDNPGGGPVGIARTTEALVVPGSLELGDIFVFAQYSPSWWPVTLRWTAPANGTINISGSLWQCGAYWTLNHNGNGLSSGAQSTDGTRDLPYQLSSGSGGVSALQNIAVQQGDYLEIGFEQWLPCFDSSAAGLNFTITLTTDSVDPVTAIEDLALTVVEMNLQNGIENSLDSKLDAAVNALIDANFNNDGAACNSLAAFISAVEAQRGKKITSAQADQLIASAQQIRAMLDCN